MATDPYKYFRIEARELLEQLGQGILELEKGPVTPELVARLLRYAHTLKGAARVVRQAGIAELAHQLEELLTAHREGAPLPKERGSALLRLHDGIRTQLDPLDPARQEGVAPAASATGDEPLETVRVEIEEMDRLLRGVAEVSVQLGRLRRVVDQADRLRGVAVSLGTQLSGSSEAGGVAPLTPSALGRARMLADELRSGLGALHRGLGVDAERLDAELEQLRERADRLRLIPAKTVFPGLDLAVRDAAVALGVQVEFQTAGGEERLDASVLAALRDALTHVVRNAVTHGIEPAPIRLASRKPASGRVSLTVVRRGRRVAFVCKDDGRGIDVEAVRKALVARGRMAAGEAAKLSREQLFALLQAGGITTSSQVTELAGRGIGLDVVRATVATLKGAFRIRSDPGQGAVFEIEIPISMSSLPCLLVEAASAVASIPLDAVATTARLSEDDVARSGERDSILHQGRVLPLFSLDRALGLKRSPGARRRTRSAVVVQAGDQSVAVDVDRLMGTSNVVLHALPATVSADSIVLGATLDADGNPQLVLNPAGLIAAAATGQPHDEPPTPALPILVIDDSLTTRMLEQSILESAGYQVELAMSAEEGLAKARARRYSVFIVDVEMPGMDGFEFVATTRADAVLRDTPAILVTSRDSPEDRRRGAKAGAHAYIVKGEFDQRHLLRTLEDLLG